MKRKEKRMRWFSKLLKPTPITYDLALEPAERIEVGGHVYVLEASLPAPVELDLGTCERPHCNEKAVTVREYPPMSNLGVVRQNVCEVHSKPAEKRTRKGKGKEEPA